MLPVSFGCVEGVANQGVLEGEDGLIRDCDARSDDRTLRILAPDKEVFA